MSFDVLGDLNWPAVLGAAVAYMILGGIWYAPPVFGAAWSRASGGAMDAESGYGPAFYAFQFIRVFVASIAVAMLAWSTATDTFGEGIVLGLVTGIGLVTGVLGAAFIFDKQKPQPLNLFLIVGAYHIVGLVAVAVIVSVWN